MTLTRLIPVRSAASKARARLPLVAAIFCLMSVNCKPFEQSNRSQEEKKYMHGGLTNAAEGTEVYFILANQKLMDAKQKTPESFYVKGVVHDGEFVPKSEVLGIGELATEGRYGWLELVSHDFFPMESDRKAMTPFVKGYITDHGFVPSMRDVFNEP